MSMIKVLAMSSNVNYSHSVALDFCEFGYHAVNFSNPSHPNSPSAAAVQNHVSLRWEFQAVFCWPC